MNAYDPSHAPDPGVWRELDEQQRLVLVEHYHRRSGSKLPNPVLHATLHVVVENQLASGEAPVVRALARLRKEGLSRHDAVHAIGAVVAEMIYDLLHQKDSVQTSHARYYAAIERLTAARWRAGSQG